MSNNLRVKREEYKFGKIRGITLISLVITVVVLIILASVTIYLSLGNNGIFTKAKQAKELTNKQEATEKINLKITTAQINKYSEKQEMPTLKELSEILKNDSEIEYVTEKSQIKRIKYEVGENPTSIYTKLNEYPYEFEIDTKLQLAGINGIKISNNTPNMGIYIVGTYEGEDVSTGDGLASRLENKNTIEINIQQKYKNYKSLTVDNFLAIDSLSGARDFNISSGAKTIASYSTQIKRYDSDTGILTIQKAFTAFDDGNNTYDTCFTGRTTIYLIENTNIPSL